MLQVTFWFNFMSESQVYNAQLNYSKCYICPCIIAPNITFSFMVIKLDKKIL